MSRLKSRSVVLAALLGATGLSAFVPAWAANPANSPTLMSSQAQSNADATTQAQMAGLMQQWTAAVVGFAHQVGSAIAWNSTCSSNAVNYRPMYLYAGPGGAAACQFSSGSGTALGTVPVYTSLSGPTTCQSQNGNGTVAGINLSAPVNLAGLPLSLASAGTQQATAYQQAIGNGNTFFPAQAGGPFGGTFCAAVAYNQPAAQNMTFVTWYAPSASQINAQSNAQSSTSGQKTPQMMVFSAGQAFTNSVNNSTMGGSMQPIYTMQANGQAPSWMTGTTSIATTFFNMLGIK